jgi:hypothetical protein
VTVADESSAQGFDPGIRLVLEELRALRIEARDDRRRAEASAEADRRRAEADRQRSDERFEQALATTREAWADVRAVGLAIVKTLNRHSRILQSIDRKLGARGNGRSAEDGGRA